MITKRSVAPRSSSRRPITASRNVTANINSNRRAPAANTRPNEKYSKIMASLSPERQAFVRQLRQNSKTGARKIMAATNTTNIMARPDFLELLPLFVQKLLLLDVFGSVAMKSRQQLVPYFKVVAEQTKGETARGTVLSSPFTNRQGMDANFTGRVVKNEVIAEGGDITANVAVVYIPVLPGSVQIKLKADGVVTPLVDDAEGNLLAADGSAAGYINYSNGAITLTTPPAANDGNSVMATYQYDNETVGPDEAGNYGARMAKTHLELDEFNLVAEARELASYWSIFSAFAAQQEYGANIGDMSKEAAFSELTAELNSWGFNKLLRAASFNPQFNWDAAPVHNGSVVPHDYLNMFKLKLNQADQSIYQRTRLTRPNRLIIGSNVASYIGMLDGFRADNAEDNVGPYHAGTLDQYEVYVDPDYDVNTWVMCCKSNDIRRNSGLFGEYMPITATDPITLANMSSQQGVATMSALEIVNPDTVVGGKILSAF